MDLRINIATPNGTGSLTANTLLTKIILKNGLFCSSKNLFPSNIAGLPTWFNIRLNSSGFTGFKDETDIYVGFNKSTLIKDISTLNKDKSIIVTNKDFKLEGPKEFKQSVEIPIRELTKPLCDSPSLRKLLGNLVYVGYLSELLGCKREVSLEVLDKEFSKRSEELLTLNKNAFLKGFEFVSEKQLESENDLILKKTSNTKALLIDGNTASGLGFLDGGASVVTWYPITPSSSLVESFEKFSKQVQNPDEVTVLQCEDEISSAVAVLGAGWSGARAFSATSGPGLSLMQESIGLGYFSEVPMVIADVQRAGPSTGLPTRTAQGDLILAHYSSHGDTLHPVLIPSSIQEVYEDSINSLNAAEILQTPVILLSDLDLGMNNWSSPDLDRSKNLIKRGNVITSDSSDTDDKSFKRYALKDKLPQRSLPRISEPSLTYFTRGSGHDEYGNYSENPEVYKNLLEKLKNKIVGSRDILPSDIKNSVNADYSLIFCGSTSQAVDEIKSLVKADLSTYQVRALPVSDDLYNFSSKYKINFVLDQNRDGQLCKIIKAESSSDHSHIKFLSLCQFNGLPTTATHFAKIINKFLESQEG